MQQIYSDPSGTRHEYSQVVRLDESDYRLVLRWNTRTDHWYLSLYALDETPIVQGKMVTTNTNLLRGCTVAGRPTGRLFAVPLDGRVDHAGLTDLGARVVIWYAGADE